MRDQRCVDIERDISLVLDTLSLIFCLSEIQINMLQLGNLTLYASFCYVGFHYSLDSTHYDIADIVQYSVGCTFV